LVNKKTILIICRNNLAKAPRFLMEINALKDNFNIIGAGLSAPHLDKNYYFIDIGKTKQINFHFGYPYLLKKTISLIVKFFVSIKRKISLFEYNLIQLNKLNYDLIIVHHFSDLELAVKLSREKKVKVIFNAHEYYPLEFDNEPEWMKMTHPLYSKIAKDFLSHVEICFCVGEKIAEKYYSEYGLKSLIVNNSKPFYDLVPVQVGSIIKIVHHGAAIKERELELMFEIMEILGEFYELNLILMPGEQQYFSYLMDRGLSMRNVKFHSPVETEEIPLFLNRFDIGLFLLPPTNFNYKYALPNKFFEFVQARLAIAVGPSPEMKSLVEKYDLGVVSGDFNAATLANMIKNSSKEKIGYFKSQSHKYARELSAEKSELTITNAVEQILI